ncbi:MAG: DUF1566 domain-containing protein [Myxococcaceae bacterium]|nr:DUF1566 domain-containing protein [Myxococcaceae bacterium]
MNQIFVSIFFVFALSPNLFAWNLLGHRPAWLQDAYSEVARMGRQIRDSVREVKPLSLGSAWVPLTRIGDDYIAQMIQRDQRMKELRQKMHRLRQIDKASEASAAEEELLRLIELGDLPEKHSKAGALKIGLELRDAVPGELSLPASKAKDSVPGLRLVPAGGPPPQPNPLPINVRHHLPDPGIPWEMSERVFKNKTLVPNATYTKAEVLPSDPEWDFVWRYFYHDKPTKWGLSRVYCVHDRDQTNAFESNIARLEKDAIAFKPTWDTEPRADQRAIAIERWRQAVAAFSPFQIKENDGRRRTFQNTKILPLWHGSSQGKCHGIANNGFAFFGKSALQSPASGSTDDGYFGSGIYFTNSARYAGDSYSGGHLMMAWVSMTEPFPVVGDSSQSDMALLRGETAYKHYNAHYIPVVPTDDSFDCSVYYPCLVGQAPVCDELVIFQRSQALPRFWVELRWENPLTIGPSQMPAFAGDLIPVLMRALEHADAHQRLRRVLNQHLERFLQQARDNEEMRQQFAQLFNGRGEMDLSVYRALTGLVFTQAMRSDPFKRVDDWYKGQRDAQDVPALEWDGRSPRPMTFEEAKAYVASRSSGGWRLPTIWELETLYQQRSVLGEKDDRWYWSGTPIDGKPGCVWVVGFGDGVVVIGGMSSPYYIRCVR